MWLSLLRDVATGEQGGDMAPPPPPLHFNYNQRKSNSFSFKHQGSGILLFAGVQKLHGPNISPFLPFILQFFGNLRWLFLNHIGQIDHVTLDLMKRFDTERWDY